MDIGHYLLQHRHLDSGCVFGDSDTQGPPATVPDENRSDPRLHAVPSVRTRGPSQTDTRQPLLVDSHVPADGAALLISTLPPAIATHPLQEEEVWQQSARSKRTPTKAFDSNTLFTSSMTYTQGDSLAYIF